MSVFNRRNLEQLYYMTVQNILFASDAIGAASGTGRSADSAAWIATDEVVFSGKLKHHLIFAVMAFQGSTVSISETFDIVPAREFLNVQNLTPTDIVDVVSLDPDDGEGIVTADDVTFLANFTNNFRLSPTTEKVMIMSAKADQTKTIYQGSVLEHLCYLLQFDSVGDAPVYTLQDVALKDVPGSKIGTIYDDIASNNGPTEFEQYLVSIANYILSQ